jgi:3-dehydroquinate dehydratase-2
MAEMRILLLNGPNLNTLGTREPEIYGTNTLADIERMVSDRARAAGAEVRAFQSNVEGEMIDWLQREAPAADGLIINAASYTHTSLALRDTITAVAIPAVEVHISNIYRREEFRHHSYISPVCVGGIFGLGVQGYELAVDALLRHIKGTE